MRNKNPVKRYLKRGAQHISSRLGPFTRNSKHPQLLILMYHRVLPTTDERCQYEEPGMIVTPKSFKLHLELLADSMTFIGLADWAERKNNNQPLPTNACAITFDDGWSDNYEFAFPILKEKSVPATIYLVSDMTGTTRIFWPERLARTLSLLAVSDERVYNHTSVDWLNNIQPIRDFAGTQPTQEQISQIINQAKSLNDNEIHARINMIESAPGFNAGQQPASLVNWEQLLEMTDSGIIEAGSHTRHHIRLDQNTTDKILHDEILNSKTIIEEHTDKPVKTFCFPNGDYCNRSMDMVRQNYTAAVTTAAGWNSSMCDNHSLKRIGVHEGAAYDKTAFLANISGWL